MLVNYNQEGETLSSSAAVYVDDTLVAYEVKKLFHEAAKRWPEGREIDFFEKKGSLNCLARVITKRINQRLVSLDKRSDIRRAVKKFLQFLENTGILRKAAKGPRHDKWLFMALPMSRLEVVNSDGVSIVESASPKASRQSERPEMHSKSRGKAKKARLSYVNDSRYCLRHT